MGIVILNKIAEGSVFTFIKLIYWSEIFNNFYNKFISFDVEILNNTTTQNFKKSNYVNQIIILRKDK